VLLKVGGLAVIRSTGQPVAVVDRWFMAGQGISCWRCSDGNAYFGRELVAVDEDGFFEADLDWQFQQTVSLDGRSAEVG